MRDRAANIYINSARLNGSIMDVDFLAIRADIAPVAPEKNIYFIAPNSLGNSGLPSDKTIKEPPMIKTTPRTLIVCSASENNITPPIKDTEIGRAHV